MEDSGNVREQQGPAAPQRKVSQEPSMLASWQESVLASKEPESKASKSGLGSGQEMLTGVRYCPVIVQKVNSDEADPR